MTAIDNYIWHYMLVWHEISKLYYEGIENYIALSLVYMHTMSVLNFVSTNYSQS